MKNPWLLALSSGLFFAAISVLTLLFEVRFAPPYKDIFEIFILLCTIVVPHILITRLLGRNRRFMELALQGWSSFIIYFLVVFIYFLLIREGSYSGDITTSLFVFSIAFVICLISATIFRRKF